MTIKNPRRLGALALVAAFAIGACTGNTGATASPSTAGGSAPAGVTGSVSVSGSSTVEPISTGVAELLKESNPDFNYTIEGPGTGDGFKRFCRCPAVLHTLRRSQACVVKLETLSHWSLKHDQPAATKSRE